MKHKNQDVIRPIKLALHQYITYFVLELKDITVILMALTHLVIFYFDTLQLSGIDCPILVSLEDDLIFFISGFDS